MRIFPFYLKNLFEDKKVGIYIVAIMALLLLMADVLSAEIISISGLDETQIAETSYSFLVDVESDKLEDIKNFSGSLKGLKDAYIAKEYYLENLPDPVEIICYLGQISEDRDYSGDSDLDISTDNIGYHFKPGYDIAGRKMLDNIITDSYMVHSDMHVEGSYPIEAGGFIYCNPQDYKKLTDGIDVISFYFESKLSDSEVTRMKLKIDDICGGSLQIKPKKISSFQWGSVMEYIPAYITLILIVIWCEMEIVLHLLECNCVQTKVFRLSGADRDLLTGLEILTIVVLELFSYIPGSLIYWLVLRSGQIVESNIEPPVLSFANLVLLSLISIFVFSVRKLIILKGKGN